MVRLGFVGPVGDVPEPGIGEIGASLCLVGEWSKVILEVLHLLRSRDVAIAEGHTQRVAGTDIFEHAYVLRYTVCVATEEGLVLS